MNCYSDPDYLIFEMMGDSHALGCFINGALIPFTIAGAKVLLELAKLSRYIQPTSVEKGLAVALPITSGLGHFLPTTPIQDCIGLGDE